MQNEIKHKFWIYILALLIVFLWGATFVNTKVLYNAGVQPLEIFVIRFVIAYFCIWLISPKKLWANSWRDELNMLWLGITGGSLYFLAENHAIGLSIVTNGIFLVCTAPLVTGILGLIFVKSVKASWRLIIGSLVAVVGVGLVIFNGHFVLHLNPLGDLLALLASFAWAVYSLLMKRFSKQYSAIFITRKVFFYGLLTVLPVFFFHSWTTSWHTLCEPKIWINLVFLGIIASFVCFLLWAWVIAKIGAMKASNLIYLNPVSTFITSAIFLNEAMTVMAFLGSAFILIGVIIANKADGIDS